MGRVSSVIIRQYFQDIESLCGSHMSSHRFSKFFLGAPSVLLMVSLMLYAEGNTSSLLLHAVCYSPAYAFKDCISSPGHSTPHREIYCWEDLDQALRHSDSNWEGLIC